MSRLTLSAALESFLLEDRAPSTRVAYRRTIGQALAFFGPERDADLVTREDVLRYVSHLRERTTRYADHPRRPTLEGPLSPATVQKHVKTLTSFFGWMVEQGIRPDNPAANLKLKRYRRAPGESKAATPEELQAILKVAEAKAALGQPKHLAIFLFLCDTGCRAGEAASLIVNNLLLDQLGAWVIGKGDKLRPVFFGEATADALRAWLAAQSDLTPQSTVFGMTAASISQTIYRMAKTAGIERSLKAHSIRHRVGQVWASAKLGERATQLKLGHDNPAVTVEMYYNTTWEHIQSSSRQLSLAAIYGLPSEPRHLSAPTILPLPDRLTGTG